jgi:hypothetical protein
LVTPPGHKVPSDRSQVAHTLWVQSTMLTGSMVTAMVLTGYCLTRHSSTHLLGIGPDIGWPPGGVKATLSPTALSRAHPVAKGESLVVAVHPSIRYWRYKAVNQGHWRGATVVATAHPGW